MPAFTYVHIVNLATKTAKHIHFKKLSEAIKYVKSYPCKGHFVYAMRYSEVLCMKSDVNMNFGFHFFDRIAKGQQCLTCDDSDVFKTDVN